MRKKNSIKNRNCGNCRYKNSDKSIFPCSVGKWYMEADKNCGLWEKPLLIQRVIWKLKENFNAKRFLEDGGENDNLGC